MDDVVPLLCEIFAWHNVDTETLLGVVLRYAPGFQHAGEQNVEDFLRALSSFPADDLREMAADGSRNAVTLIQVLSELFESRDESEKSLKKGE
jgi:hypothetical protein